MPGYRHWCGRLGSSGSAVGFQRVDWHKPLAVGVDRQERVFQGRGSEQDRLSLLAECYRRGELLALEPYGDPSLLSRYAPAVGQHGCIGAVRRYIQGLQKGPGGLGKSRAGAYEGLDPHELLAGLVAYLECGGDSSHCVAFVSVMTPDGWAILQRGDPGGLCSCGLFPE